MSFSLKKFCLPVHSGWNLRCMDSGNMHHFVGADNSCISWGHAQYGELGYGPNGQKYLFLTTAEHFLFKGFLSCPLLNLFLVHRSSAVPKKVDILEGMHVIK